MKVAIIGIRGVPFVYSGFESFAMSFCRYFSGVKKWDITVYNRSHYFPKKDKFYGSTKLFYLPSIKSKYFETFVHSFLSTIHVCVFRNYDIVYYLGVGSVIFSFLPRLFGIPTVVNVDGLDWKREKWGTFGKLFLYTSAYLSKFLPTQVITDSVFMEAFYKLNYNNKTVYIPYSNYDPGEKTEPSRDIVTKYKLKKSMYIVWVGRLVPDNHIEDLLQAISNLPKDFKCVVIGDDLYETEYKNHILAQVQKKSNLVLTGFIGRTDYLSLLNNSFAYIETKRSSGTHPSLIDALEYSPLIISNNYIANKIILENSAIYYDYSDKKSLKEILSTFSKKQFQQKAQLNKKRLRHIFKRKFIWKNIATQYENLFLLLTR